MYAGAGTSPGQSRDGDALVRDWEARQGGEVLGGSRTPGVPTVQRMRHDDVGFTVTVAPARPGTNLVRVDSTRLGEEHAHTSLPVLVGTGEDDLVRARPRPGTDGLWAVVDLPEGSGTVLVTHGPRHRVPFAVETGTTPADPIWSGPDGPECLAATTAAILAGGGPLNACPAASLSPADETALRSVVDTLGTRGVEQLAVERDDSARSGAAYDVVSAAAADAGIRVVEPSAEPAGRSALLVVAGWDDAATSLSRITALPLRQQPLRTDGTWLAPWLLTPAVVDSTLGAVRAAGLRHPRSGRARNSARPWPATCQDRRRPARRSWPGAPPVTARPHPSSCTPRPGPPTCPAAPATPDTRRPSPGSRAARSPRSARPPADHIEKGTTCPSSNARPGRSCSGRRVRVPAAAGVRRARGARRGARRRRHRLHQAPARSRGSSSCSACRSASCCSTAGSGSPPPGGSWWPCARARRSARTC